MIFFIWFHSHVGDFFWTAATYENDFTLVQYFTYEMFRLTCPYVLTFASAASSCTQSVRYQTMALTYLSSLFQLWHLLLLISILRIFRAPVFFERRPRGGGMQEWACNSGHVQPACRWEIFEKSRSVHNFYSDWFASQKSSSRLCSFVIKPAFSVKTQWPFNWVTKKNFSFFFDIPNVVWKDYPLSAAITHLLFLLCAHSW